MVMEQGIKVIVMLTKEEENQRVKCSRYFADAEGDADNGGVLRLSDMGGVEALNVKIVEQTGLTGPVSTVGSERSIAVRRKLAVWTVPGSALGQSERFGQYSQEHPYDVRSNLWCMHRLLFCAVGGSRVLISFCLCHLFPSSIIVCHPFLPFASAKLISLSHPR